MKKFLAMLLALIMVLSMAACGSERGMEGKGTILTCHNCGKQHELTPLGELKALEGETKISHIPDYYRWEREQVRQEILDGS